MAPVIYDDNLFTLFPGESRDIDISYNRSDLPGKAFVAVSCYNNVINGKDSRAATNIYTTVPQGGSNNIARGKTVTGGTDPLNATDVTPGGQANADEGRTFIDSDMNTFATLSPEQGAFVVDLDSVRSFDRIMLRWNRMNGLRGRPDHVRIEVSNDNEQYTEVVSYDNSNMGSVMTNIIIPAQARGRYVRIIPSGLTGMSPAVGMRGGDESGASGQSASGIRQADASKVFNLSAIEIYTFK